MHIPLHACQELMFNFVRATPYVISAANYKIFGRQPGMN